MSATLATLSTCKLTAQTVMCMYNAAKIASNLFLTHKIENFAKEPFSEKSLNYISEMDQSKFEELEQQIIHALTHAESVVKAIYVKNLTEAHCRGDIDWLTFCRMNFILSQTFTFDLKTLVLYYNDEISEEITTNRMYFFAQLGLVDYTHAMSTEVHDLFNKNDFGANFIKCALPQLNEESKKRCKKTEEFVDEYL